MTDFLKHYLNILTSQYSSVLSLTDLDKRFANLVSDIEVHLPLSVYERVSTAVKNIYRCAHSDSYLKALLAESRGNDNELLLAEVKNSSVLMAYDFHYSFESDKLSLIEINTNASGYLIVELIYQALSKTAPPWGNALNNLKESFLNELQLAEIKKSPRIAIIDDHIDQQKMYSEFLMFEQLFKSWGWQAALCDQARVPLDKVDLIYNRSTDFLFSDPNLLYLRQAFLSKQLAFSPHPKEYLLLAAKDRLITLSEHNASETIPKSFYLKGRSDYESIWSGRKNLFFKPLRSYGSKGAYKGSSISRKTFEGLLNQEFLAQEYCPPGELNEWKFDLRFYAYKDRIHLGAARVYQGQVTNFNTAGGGLSRITFV